MRFSADFEAPAYQLGNIHGQQGWSVDQGSAVVTAGAGRADTVGLVLQPASPFSQARLSLTTGSAMAGVSFVDLYILPAAGENALREEMIDVDSARIGLFKTAIPDQAALWIFHGDGRGGGIWLATNRRLPIDQATGQTLGWHRLTIREDSTRQTWDLWLDGVWAVGGAGFQEPRTVGAATCIFMGDRTEPLALDELLVGPSNPLGPDADGDGLLDVLEQELGFNPASDDRDGDADGDGISNLEEGMDHGTGTKPLRPAAMVPFTLTLSQPSALVDAPVEVVVKASGKAKSIRYTLDGADPSGQGSEARELSDDGSAIITVNQSAVLRVAALGAEGEILGRTIAAYLFPAEVARFARPAGFPSQLWQASSPVALHYGSPGMGASALNEAAVKDALMAAPIVVLATAPDAWFNYASGIYAANSQKIKAPVEVILFQRDGVPAGPASDRATVSLSGESSLSHSTTPKHSLRLKWTPRATATAGNPTFGAGVLPASPEVVLRHPTHDSWVQSGPRANRRDGIYFADAFASFTLGSAGHPTLSHQWVHVFLNGAYWGVYDAVEQVAAGPASVLLNGEKTGAVSAIFGKADRWNQLMSRLKGLAEFSRQGVPDVTGWEESAAGLDQDNLIDYILVNLWMRTMDWPVKNFLITQSGPAAPFRFLSWDAEQALRNPRPGETDPLTRIREAPDGPAAAFTCLSHWTVFRQRVLERATSLFTERELSPASARASLLAQAEVFRPLAALESARWKGQFDAMDSTVLTAWETRVAALTEQDAALRGPAVLDLIRQWVTTLDQLEVAAAARHAAAAQRRPRLPGIGAPRSLVITDADGDGLPDEWELRFGLDPKNSADGKLDSDGDGFSNLHELTLGLDPTKKDDPAKHLPPSETSVFTRIQLPTIRQGKPVPQSGRFLRDLGAPQTSPPAPPVESPTPVPAEVTPPR